jgi:hypothetical protein
MKERGEVEEKKEATMRKFCLKKAANANKEQ